MIPSGFSNDNSLTKGRKSYESLALYPCVPMALTTLARPITCPCAWPNIKRAKGASIPAHACRSSWSIPRNSLRSMRRSCVSGKSRVGLGPRRKRLYVVISMLWSSCPSLTRHRPQGIIIPSPAWMSPRAAKSSFDKLRMIFASRTSENSFRTE